MKRYTAYLLALCLGATVFLSACGDDSASTSDASGSQAPASESVSASEEADSSAASDVSGTESESEDLLNPEAQEGTEELPKGAIILDFDAPESFIKEPGTEMPMIYYSPDAPEDGSYISVFIVRASEQDVAIIEDYSAVKLVKMHTENAVQTVGEEAEFVVEDFERSEFKGMQVMQYNGYYKSTESGEILQYVTQWAATGDYFLLITCNDTTPDGVWQDEYNESIANLDVEMT